MQAPCARPPLPARPPRRKSGGRGASRRASRALFIDWPRGESTMKVDRTLAAMALGALCSAAAGGEAGGWRVDLELGAVLGRSQRGGDTQLTARATASTSPIWARDPSAGITVGWRPWQRHDFQLVIAPLAYEERGTFDRDLRFAGATFASGAPTDVSYQFNSYRSQPRRRRALAAGAGRHAVRGMPHRTHPGRYRAEDSNVVPLFSVPKYAGAWYWTATSLGRPRAAATISPCWPNRKLPLGAGRRLPHHRGRRRQRQRLHLCLVQRRGLAQLQW